MFIYVSRMKVHMLPDSYLGVQGPMFPGSYIPRVLYSQSRTFFFRVQCSQSPILPVPRNMCSLVLIFHKSYIPRIISFQNPMFLEPYIPGVLHPWIPRALHISRVLCFQNHIFPESCVPWLLYSKSPIFPESYTHRALYSQCSIFSGSYISRVMYSEFSEKCF